MSISMSSPVHVHLRVLTRPCPCPRVQAVKERMAEVEKKLESVRPILRRLTEGIDPEKPVDECVDGLLHLIDGSV